MRIALAVVLLIGAIALICGGNSAHADEAEDQETAAMQGEWEIESITLDGNVLAPETLKTWRRTVENSHVVWKNGNELLLETDIKIYAAAQPKTLDSTMTAGAAKGQTVLAIYQLKGDELRVCFANPGKPRPTEFTSTSGSGQSIYVAKRVKP